MSRLNDAQRNVWIDNDEGLYDWWRASKMTRSNFIRAYRAELTEVISAILEGRQPAHYLKYTHTKDSHT